jgi:hypothetical protein
MTVSSTVPISCSRPSSSNPKPSSSTSAAPWVTVHNVSAAITGSTSRSRPAAKASSMA